MATLFLICAAVGGTVLIIQFVLSLIGLGGEHDVGAEHVDVGGDHVDFGGDHDFAGDHVDVSDHHFDVDHHDTGAHDVHHDASWFFSILSFRSLVAAIAFFGLGGLWATSSGWPAGSSLLLAMGAAAVAMFIVGWLMSLLHNLGAEGTVRIEATVGQPASVYLTIPPAKQGSGKVTVKVQNRTMEYLAVTKEDKELRSGEQVRVTGIVSSDTVEVEGLS